jgi:anti-sigma regulatory factor (Ser/Thr protein kinase)
MIAVQATIDVRTLKITLEDTAHPFDPTQQDTPTDLDMPLDERNIGGLGIFLALNGIDDFTYERVDNRNRNTLVVYRPESEVSA